MKKIIASLLFAASMLAFNNLIMAQITPVVAPQPTAAPAAPVAPVSPSTPVAPKTPPSPEKIASKQTEHMKMALALTDDQTAKVGDINLRYAQKGAAIRSSEIEQQLKVQQFKEMQTAKDAELKQVLTEEQYKKLLELRTQHAPQGAQNLKAPVPAPAPGSAPQK